MVKRVAGAAVCIIAAVALLSGTAGAAHKSSSAVGCSISVGEQTNSFGQETGVISVIGWGLSPGKSVTMWYSVPNMAGFLNVDTVAADGTIQDVSYTTYIGTWLGSTWTYTAQIWQSSTGVIGKGSPLSSCSVTTSL